jgi:hypothetical protein
MPKTNTKAKPPVWFKKTIQAVDIATFCRDTLDYELGMPMDTVRAVADAFADSFELDLDEKGHDEFITIVNANHEGDEAEGVVPPTPVVNRATKQETHFGPRRAYDGAYIGELLAATGCTAQQVAIAKTVLDALTEHNQGDWTAEQLARIFGWYNQICAKENSLMVVK